MSISYLIQKAKQGISLPSSLALNSADLDATLEYPDFATMSMSDSPTLSANWLRQVGGRKETRPRDGLPLAQDDLEKARLSVDVESQASTDASTLLDDDSEPRRQSSTVAAGARLVSDAIIGLSDGLTVPFALTAGLSALGDTRLVIYGGAAELIAGAISMGLGGYLAAKSEEDSYRETHRITQRQIDLTPSEAASSVAATLAPFELPQHLSNDLVAHLTKSPHLLSFLMQFHHGLPEATSSRAITCALTIALGYFLGGFIPLLPYFLVQREEVMLALYWSLAVMAGALFAFGYGKTCFVSGWRGRDNTWKGIKGGAQMMIIGGIAAGCAMGLVRLFNSFVDGS